MSKLRIATLALIALVMSILLAACSGPGSNNVVPGSDEGTYALNVSVQGPGTVVIDAIDFSCSDECTTRIGAGVAVELRAEADSGKGFVGWQQACSGPGTCTVPMDSDADVSAVFADNVLALGMAGDGSGTVRIVPPDINCQDDCAQAYPGPLSVSLTVTLSEGTEIEGWGADCSDSGTSRQCVVDVSGQTNVSLTLVQPPVANPDSYSVNEDQTLSVGAGNGVLSNDSDSGGGSLSAQLVSGPSDGELDLDADGSFTYSPAAPGEYSFSYRARDASGNLSDTTQVTISVRRLPTHELTVDKSGLGDGSVTSDPSGIDCGSDCSGEFKAGTSVTLTASPAGDSSFAGWGGACSGSDETCTVSMDAAKGVTARFELLGFPLSTSVEGPGTVTSSPGGIDCEPDCRDEYSPGTTVTLTATPNQDSTFERWGGACSGASGRTCQVEMTQGRSVSASFAAEEEPPPPPDRTLTVSASGDGQGEITSSPGGIDCGGDCSHSYPDATDVTLTAAEEPGSTFDGWSGCDSVDGDRCTVTMDSDKSVTASFGEEPATANRLDVNTAGQGTVTSDDGGIDCDPDCEEEYSPGTSVDLRAAEADGWQFEGWSGCDSVNGDRCTVTMDSGKSVTASFGEEPATANRLDVNTAGEGTVTSDDGGIDCEPDCEEDYDENSEVTLTADPGEDAQFDGWSGDCDEVSNSSCTVTMNTDKSVSATFSELMDRFALDVDVRGDGTVVSDDGGIECPGECDETYGEGETVTLTAAPGEGSQFSDWGGDCADESESSCTVTMDSGKSVTASFEEFVAQFPLHVTVEGDGSVASEDGGISCPNDCDEEFNDGDTATLTATPADESEFDGWSGGCSGTENPCTLTIAGEENVTAFFNPLAASFTLALQFNGDGSGSVAIDPSDTDTCSEDCSVSYDEVTDVTLTARPETGSVFQWGGDCSGDSSPCDLVIDEDKSVTISFDAADGADDGGDETGSDQPEG